MYVHFWKKDRRLGIDLCFMPAGYSSVTEHFFIIQLVWGFSHYYFLTSFGELNWSTECNSSKFDKRNIASDSTADRSRRQTNIFRKPIQR